MQTFIFTASFPELLLYQLQRWQSNSSLTSLPSLLKFQTASELDMRQGKKVKRSLIITFFRLGTCIHMQMPVNPVGLNATQQCSVLRWSQVTLQMIVLTGQVCSANEDTAQPDHIPLTDTKRLFLLRVFLNGIWRPQSTLHYPRLLLINPNEHTKKS